MHMHAHAQTHTGVAASAAPHPHTSSIDMALLGPLGSPAGDSMLLASPKVLSVRTHASSQPGGSLPSSLAAPRPWETMNEANYSALISSLDQAEVGCPQRHPPQDPECPASGCQLSGLAVSSILEGPF